MDTSAGTSAAQADAPDRGTRAAAPWAADAERGSRLALRVMAFIALACGRRVARAVLHPIVVYFLVFAPRARRQSARYLGRALGRRPRLGDRYRHLHAFASTVLDRVYLARGQLGRFALRVSGAELMARIVAEGRGAVLLGAHVGSFEALHAVGVEQPGLRVAMAMFPDNARLIHGVLEAVAPGLQLDIVPIGRPESTLALRDRLDAGALVGLLGDRHLHDDGARTALVELPFLGVPARWSLGPLRLAQLLKRRVVFMAGIYEGGKRYDVRFEPLADFSDAPRDAATREAHLRAALVAYVQRLEALCRARPYNWFNFYDFWAEDAPA